MTEPGISLEKGRTEMPMNNNKVFFSAEEIISVISEIQKRFHGHSFSDDGGREACLLLKSFFKKHLIENSKMED